MISYQQFTSSNFHRLFLAVWFTGITATIVGYAHASATQDVGLNNKVFWFGALLIGISLGFCAHMAFTYHGKLISHRIKERYHRHFDFLVYDDINRAGDFVALISDQDILHNYRKMQFYLRFTFISIVVFTANIIVGRYIIERSITP